MPKDLSCCAYPFLYEDSGLCDYEIATDSLAGMLGFAKSFAKEAQLTEDIEALIGLVYHANASARTMNTITQEDVDYILARVAHYKSEIQGMIQGFVLPQGGHLAGALHIARSKGKECIRKLFAVKQEGRNIAPILFDFLNIITNYIFILAVYANKIEKIEEVKFSSRNY